MPNHGTGTQHIAPWTDDTLRVVMPSTQRSDNSSFECLYTHTVPSQSHDGTPGTAYGSTRREVHDT